MNLRRPFSLLPLLLLLLVASSSATTLKGPAKITVEDALAYLEHGGAESLKTSSTMREYVLAGHPPQTWHLYIDSAEVLGNHRVRAAIPLLRARILEPLPYQLRRDMVLFVAFTLRDKDSWQYLEQQAHNEEQYLRSVCAQALVEIDAEEGLKTLQTFFFKASLDSAGARTDEQGEDLEKLPFSFIWAFRALIEAGRPEGLEYLLDLLPHAPLNEWSNAWITVYEVMGHQVPAPKFYAAVEPEELAGAWKTWWQENRATLSLPIPEDARPPGHVDFPSKPKTPEEYLRYRYSPTPYGSPPLDSLRMWNRAQSWIERNAPKHLDLWQALAEEASESPELRIAAANLYIKHGGQNGVAWGSDWLKSWEDPEELGRAFYKLVDVYSAMNAAVTGEGIRTARAHVMDMDTYSIYAYHYLANFSGHCDPSILNFLLKQRPQIEARFCGHEGEIWSAVQGCHTPEAHAFLEAQLLNGTVEDAKQAEYLLQEWNGSQSLSEPARIAREKWLKNPDFLIEALPRDADYSPALDLIQGTDPEAAVLYSRIFRLSRDRESPHLSPTAARALEGLKACANAYLERLYPPGPLDTPASVTQRQRAPRTYRP